MKKPKPKRKKGLSRTEAQRRRRREVVAAQRAAPLAPVDPNQRYHLWEAMRYLRRAESTTYALIKSGHIKVIRELSGIFIPGTEIIRLSTLPPGAGA